MIKVHHLERSRSHRVLWLLEELGVEYEIVRYERNPKTKLAPPELRKIHPLGKSPVLQDGERVLAESGAILQYIVDKYGDGKLMPPPGSEEHLQYTFWMHYAEGSLMSPLLLALVLGKMGPLGWPAQPFVKKQLKTHFGFVEQSLKPGQWLLGDAFSAADIQMNVPLEAAWERAGLSRQSHPRIAGLLEKHRARPAYARAIDRGGPIDMNF